LQEFRQEGEVDESKKAAATDIDKVAAETEKLTLATEVCRPWESIATVTPRNG